MFPISAVVSEKRGTFCFKRWLILVINRVRPIIAPHWRGGRSLIPRFQLRFSGECNPFLVPPFATRVWAAGFLRAGCGARTLPFFCRTWDQDGPFFFFFFSSFLSRVCSLLPSRDTAISVFCLPQILQKQMMRQSFPLPFLSSLCHCLGLTVPPIGSLCRDDHWLMKG